MSEKWVRRTEYNNVISVKIVIPGGCNARCKFCYNRDMWRKNIREVVPFAAFRLNLNDSLKTIIEEIGEKDRISIDITGNEPTCNIPDLMYALAVIRNYKECVSRVTLTTNAFFLEKLIPFLPGIVDYVNISLHDFREKYRRRVMDWSVLDVVVKSCVEKLNGCGIPCSAVAVIWKKYQDFSWWRDRFIEWCKEYGFISLRFRCNVHMDDQSFFDEYMEQTINDPRFQVITHENTPDSHWCRLRMEDKFRVFFLHGVKDTTKFTKGIEYVIADDGGLYTDYKKQHPIGEYEFKIGEIYDRVVEV